MLLQDMLAMQQNVYTCLDPAACYEVTLPELISFDLEILVVTDRLSYTKAMTRKGSHLNFFVK